VSKTLIFKSTAKDNLKEIEEYTFNN